MVSSLRIPGMAPLVDYGSDDHESWIEAYGTPGPGLSADLRGRCPQQGELEDVTRLLARAGCTVRLRCDERPEHADAASPFMPVPLQVVNMADADVTAEPGGFDRVRPILGTILQRREELDQVVEVALGGGGCGARLLGIDAPAGAGLSSFFVTLAREARRLGFVPLSSRVWSDAFEWPPGVSLAALVPVLRRRHVMVLDDHRCSISSGRASPGAADVACLLGSLDLAEGRPHLVVSAPRSPAASPSISLRPLSARELRRSVLCVGIAQGRLDPAVGEALRRSGGWPGAFVRVLRSLLHLPAEEEPYRQPRLVVGLVREDVTRTGPGFGTADTAAIFSRARALTDSGRHAGAERLLRRTIGFLGRRQLMADAARGYLALGRLQSARGRRKAAVESFEESRRLSDRAHDAGGVVSALLHLGAVLIDDGALPAAEAALRTAQVGASHGEMATLGRAARLLIARCLFWQGNHRAAWEQVQQVTGSSPCGGPIGGAVAERADPATDGSSWGSHDATAWLPPGVSAIPAEIGVRMALLNHDAGQAAKRLAAAGPREPGDDPVRSGTLCTLAILIQGALGDSRAAARELSAGLELLRRRHAPIAAQELRIAYVRALLDAGDRAQAAVQLRRLAERRSPAMSGLARTALDDLAARLRDADDAPMLEAPFGDIQIDTGAVLRILQHCQEADDDQGAVAGVCEAVRSTLHAAAVTAFLTAPGAVSIVANAGGRACRPDVAERSLNLFLIVGPEDAPLGREASAPVRYGGAAVGAIAARWTADAISDGSRVRGVLAAAAAAVAPAIAALRGQGAGATRGDSPVDELSGSSDSMAELRRQVARAALAPYPVLVLGESGTGKELIARAIHAGSLRKHRRFCAVNCAALSDELFETELFGHTRGAFTGAASDRPGLFEEADGGTLFLDEVGELSPRAQAKLLRAIQEGEIRRVGENHARRVDTRIVAATNRLLADEVRHGRFRHDLLFRLDVVKIVVPPLRDRPEDIAPLALEFWREATRRTGGHAQLAPATLAALARYDWPGNVRELQNALAALAVQAPARGRVGPSCLPAAVAGPGVAARTESITLGLARRRFEARFVRATLARTGGRRNEAAEALGLTRQGLAKLMARLGIEMAGGERPAAAPGP